MARPTGGALTGAGFAQVGSSNVYTKTSGTALAEVDITGNAGQGHVAIKPAVAGAAVSKSDVLSHLGTLNGLGVGLALNAEDFQCLTVYTTTL